MRKYLAACVAVALLTLPLSALADEACPDPARPHHYSVLCLTESELQAQVAQDQLAPPTAPPVAPVDLVRQLAYYYWPDWAAERMIRIAKCESGYNPAAWNPSGASGLWQIMPFWQRTWPGDYFDPWTNAAVAYQIWLEADRWGDPFRPWVCRG